MRVSVYLQNLHNLTICDIIFGVDRDIHIHPLPHLPEETHTVVLTHCSGGNLRLPIQCASKVHLLRHSEEDLTKHTDVPPTAIVCAFVVPFHHFTDTGEGVIKNGREHTHIPISGFDVVQ